MKDGKVIDCISEEKVDNIKNNQSTMNKLIRLIINNFKKSCE